MVSDRQRAFRNAKVAYEYINRLKPLHKNCVRLNAGNTDRHEGFKYLICRQLNKEGKDFYTECPLINGRVADVLVPSELKIIEVLASETQQEFLARVQNYFPGVFDVVGVNCNQKWSEKLIY